jgi:hypothetical protein
MYSKSYLLQLLNNQAVMHRMSIDFSRRTKYFPQLLLTARDPGVGSMDMCRFIQVFGFQRFTKGLKVEFLALAARSRRIPPAAGAWLQSIRMSS